jgi:type VI secretion system secreted protein Hcp
MADHTTTRRTLLAGTLGGSALGGLVLTSDAEAAVSVPSAPAVDFFVALPGVPGESVDEQFPNTFDTLDWSFGETTSVSPTNTGNGVGKVKPQPFVFVKHVDKASPALFLKCATGKHFPKATITARKRSSKEPYLQVVLHDVYISSYRTAPGSVDAVPLDVVGLDYGSVLITFTPQNPDGSLGTPIEAGFDFVKNKVL